MLPTFSRATFVMLVYLPSPGLAMFLVVSPRIETFSELELSHSGLVDKLRSRIAAQQISHPNIPGQHDNYTKELA